MKIALPIRNGRISPVFDVAVRLLVVEIEGGLPGRHSELVPGRHSEFTIRESGSEVRAELLQELGVMTLICGAISNQAAHTVERCGIGLKPWVVGEIGDVIDAWCKGTLDSDGFIMPGCRQGEGVGRGIRRGNGQGRRSSRRGGGRRNRE